MITIPNQLFKYFACTFQEFMLNPSGLKGEQNPAFFIVLNNCEYMQK